MLILFAYFPRFMVSVDILYCNLIDLISILRYKVKVFFEAIERTREDVRFICNQLLEKCFKRNFQNMWFLRFQFLTPTSIKVTGLWSGKVQGAES